MATIVNNPAPVQERDNGSGFLLGVIILIVAAFFVMMYVLPYLSNTLRGPQITVPGKIDVNVNTTKK